MFKKSNGLFKKTLNVLTEADFACYYTTTYSVSYFSRRTVTKEHVTDLRMLRL
jgi:hypothetical protein